MAIKINSNYVAKSCSRSSTKRKLSDVKYIVIHYTGNNGDTAANNAKYFATSNERSAGAHYFIDQKGEIYQSIDPIYTAWAVGGFYTSSNGAGGYYKKCTNANSVSIELCDLADGKPSWAMKKATRNMVKHIKSLCPNATTIIRHWDVNGKDCPTTMAGKDNDEWKRFKSFIKNGYECKMTVTKNVECRSAAKLLPTVKIGVKLKKGSVVKVKRFDKTGKFAQIVTPDACKAKGYTTVWVLTSKLK